MHLLLCKQCLPWLRHVHWMEDGNIPKDPLYGQVATGSQPVGHPLLHYNDTCKRELNLTEIDTESWETVAVDFSTWRSAIKECLERRERKRNLLLAEKRNQWKNRQQNQLYWPQGATIVIQDGQMPSISNIYKCSDKEVFLWQYSYNNI